MSPVSLPWLPPPLAPLVMSSWSLSLSSAVGAGFLPRAAGAALTYLRLRR